MATPVIMPRQGQSVESCIIGQWHKQKGDAVAIGDTLFTYETDKATFDEVAAVAGTMLDVFFEEGDDVPCLLNVCVIGEPGEDVSSFVPEGAEGATQETPVAQAAVSATEAAAVSAPTVVSASDGATSGAVSPRAKHLATRSGADLRQASATGPEGRVIERDVRALIDAGKMATSALTKPVSPAPHWADASASLTLLLPPLFHLSRRWPWKHLLLLLLIRGQKSIPPFAK